MGLKDIEAKLAAKRKPKARGFGVTMNVAEPAHTIITRCGGVRKLQAALAETCGYAISAAAISRWQTAKTKAKPKGGDGVIPSAWRESIIEVSKLSGNKRVYSKDF